MKKRALISVSDKTNVTEFAKNLIELGYEIISTGGTLKQLSADGVKCISISDVTGFPECLDGRVKTLHPAVHAGILALRSDESHMKQLKELNIDTIDLVAVNLYPFKQTIEKEGVTFAEAVENIDIGGPTMLRSAAKNYQDVYVVVDPADYQTVIEDIKSGGGDIAFKQMLMYKVYQHTAVYDTIIANYLRNKAGIEFPQQITFAYEKAQDMRYGENPHQSAVYYKELFRCKGSLSDCVQLHGKELSFNNINDTNGALDLLREFDTPAVVGLKHTNPCGVGLGDSIYEAYMNAYEADKISIFGGIIAANGVIDGQTAREINKIFVEIVVAKDFTDEALDILKQKKNIRLLKLESINAPVKQGTYDMKKVMGGMLVQQFNDKLFDREQLKTVTAAKVDEKTLKELEFAYKVVKHAKSNAIVLVNGNSTAGIGVGQTNRIWAAQQAIEHAAERAKGSVLASDAYFPFPDVVEAAAKAGVKAIMQPGGSVNDNLSIEACDKYGIAMVFCGMRHFKH
jgi:phosphoribosylaminoimidazolecarboxamide formyltransferase/IMP cyclohydrolase